MVVFSVEVSTTTTVPTTKPGALVTFRGHGRGRLHALMMEPPREKAAEPGKKDVNESSVPVGTVKPVATKGAKSGKSAAACLKPKLLPTKEFSTESDYDIFFR